jgi:hypothetical protein
MAVLAGPDGSNVTFRRLESPARGHPGLTGGRGTAAQAARAGMGNGVTVVGCVRIAVSGHPCLGHDEER